MNYNFANYFDEAKKLVAHNAVTNNANGLKSNIDYLIAALKEIDFSIKVFAPESQTPIILAHRPSHSSSNTIGLYAHYDVEPTPASQWNTPPLELTQVDDRLVGRGIADNLGIITLRLQAIRNRGKEDCPEIYWLFQGQEEIGSPLAHEVFPTLSLPKVEVWFEETGYFDLGTSRQRFLTLHEDETLEKAKVHVLSHLADIEFSNYTENRSLTKFDKCPFLSHILQEQPYLAMGPNDEFSMIHQPNESLSIPLIEKSYRQFQDILSFYGVVL